MILFDMNDEEMAYWDVEDSTLLYSLLLSSIALHIILLMRPLLVCR